MENKWIINRNVIVTYFKHSVLLIISLFIIFMYTEYNKRVYLIKEYKNNIDKIYHSDGIDISLFCYASNCKSITLDDAYFSPDITRNNVLTRIDNHHDNIDNSYLRYLKDAVIKDSFYIQHGKHKMKIELNTYDYSVVMNQFYTVTVFFLLWYAFIYFRNARNEVAAALLANKNVKTVLEGKLQYTVAGSMHHEMLGPITVIKDLFDEIRLAIHSQYVDDCKSCAMKQNVRNSDDYMPREVILDYIEKISSSIDRLHGVLALLRESKDNRYSNGNKNMAMLTKNLFATTSIFTSRHFEYEIKNIELLESLHLRGLPNGEYMNILSNLVTNSVEAKCSKVIIECELVNNSTLQMYCIDNGTGVLGKNNKPIVKEEYDLIFAYGVSSKTLSGDIIHEKTNFFTSLFKKIFYKPELFTSESGRGLGMYVIRETLIKYKGEISLHKTSSEGTIFKLLIPVEPYTYKKE